jgi:sugar phosphate isomerase/epimerase
MNRRQFISRSAALVAAGSIVSGQLYASVAAAPNKGRIGIQLYSIKDELAKDVKQSLKKLSDLGYSSVEPYGFTTDDFFGLTMKELSAIVKDMGMTIAGSHIWSNISVNNPTDKERDFWKNCADIVKSGDGKWAVQSSLPRVRTLDDLKRVASYFNRAGEVCSKGGVKFAYHNHDESFKEMEGEIILDYLINNTDPNHVFYQLDLGHTVNGGGDCIRYIRDFPKRIPLWHASDFDATSRKYTDVGKGDVPYTALFNLAISSGLEQLIVEQETAGDIFESCKVDFEYLKQFKWTEV